MECKKKSFLTREEAVLRVDEIQHEESKHRKPIRSYKCPVCGNYHLTSWTKKQTRIRHNLKFHLNKRDLQDQVDYWKKKLGLKDE